MSFLQLRPRAFRVLAAVSLLGACAFACGGGDDDSGTGGGGDAGADGTTLLRDGSSGTPPGSDGAARDADMDADAGTMGADGGLSTDAGSDAAVDASGDASPVFATITGKVLGESSSPLSGIKIVIQGKTATSAAEGTFSIPDIALPYDVSAVLDGPEAGAYPLVTSYLGISATTLTISLFTAQDHPSTASVSGSVTGGTNGQTYATLAAAASGSPSISGSSGTLGTDTTYTALVSWARAQPTQAVTVYGLEYAPSSGIPTSYPAFGKSTAVNVTDGAQVMNVPLPLSSLAAAGTVSGTFVAPAGYTLKSRGVEVDVAANAPFDFAEQSGATSFSFTTPPIEGATFTLTGEARGMPGELSIGTRSFPAGTSASGITVTLPTPPTLLTPAANATGVNGATEFSIAPGITSGCSYFVALAPGATGAPYYRLSTAATMFHFPDLSAIGLSPPAGATYTWSVTCLLNGGDVLGDAPSQGEAFSANRSFQLQ